MLEDFIGEEGYAVDAVQNWKEACDKLLDTSFDLVITDVRMPGLSGLDLLPGIQQTQPGVPIIVITAFGGEDVQRRALARGATVYLEKPINLEEFRNVIGRIIRP